MTSTAQFETQRLSRESFSVLGLLHKNSVWTEFWKKHDWFLRLWYENTFKSYLKDDYSKGQEDTHKPIDHPCKMGFVSVLNETDAGLDLDIGAQVLRLLFEGDIE